APCSGFRAWAARLSQLHKFLANEKPCQVQANTYRVGTLPGNLGHFLVGQSFHVAQDKNNPVRREPLPALGCPRVVAELWLGQFKDASAKRWHLPGRLRSTSIQHSSQKLTECLPN